MNALKGTAALALALAAAAALGGCAAHDAGTYAAPHAQKSYCRPVNTPAIEPDRQDCDRMNSFSDPGPNYPNTGR